MMHQNQETATTTTKTKSSIKNHEMLPSLSITKGMRRTRRKNHLRELLPLKEPPSPKFSDFGEKEWEAILAPALKAFEIFEAKCNRTPAAAAAAATTLLSLRHDNTKDVAIGGRIHRQGRNRSPCNPTTTAAAVMLNRRTPPRRLHLLLRERTAHAFDGSATTSTTVLFPSSSSNGNSGCCHGGSSGGGTAAALAIATTTLPIISPFAQFVFEGDTDDEEEDQRETLRWKDCQNIILH